MIRSRQDSFRRGLTMVELLCALTLLSLLMIGLSAWMTVCTRDARMLHARLRFETAAYAATQRVLEDLLSSDLTTDDGNRVEIFDDRIDIFATGGSAAQTRTRKQYLIENGRFIVVENTAHQPPHQRRRALMENVTVSLESIREGDEKPITALRIVLTSFQGHRFTRTLRWGR